MDWIFVLIIKIYKNLDYVVVWYLKVVDYGVIVSF